MAGGFQSYSTTPGSNTSINGINIAEGCPPSGVNDALRQLASDGTSLWQSAPTWMGTTGGSANAYTLTPTVALAAYTAGQAFRALASFSSTTTATLNISALGAKTIKRFDGSALIYADIPTGSLFDVLYDGTAFILMGPTAASGGGFKNQLVNGNFLIWQRGNIFNSPASGTYVADAWTPIYDGTGAFSINQGNFGATGNQTIRYINWNQSSALSGASTRALCHKMEYVNTLANQNATVSFGASVASGTASVTPSLTQYFGTGGSPSANVTTTGSAITVTTTGQRFFQSFFVPSIAAKTLGSTGLTDYLQLNFLLPTTGTYNISFWEVQLEPGTVPTLFEVNGPAVDTIRCLRRYQTFNGTWTGYNASPAASNFSTFSHVPPMRTTPTAAITPSGGSNYTSATIAANNSLNTTVTTTNTAAGNWAYNFNGTLTAEL